MRLALPTSQVAHMKSLVIVVLAIAGLAAPSHAQAPGAQDQQDQQTLALIKAVQAQQLAIADNQTKIEAKLAAVAEALRVARIYSSRTGQGGSN